MSEATKAAVLAKCQDVAHQVGSEFLLENGAIVFSGITEYKILGHENETRISLNHAIPADDWVWPLAAQILNLIRTVDEFESETSARQYAHDLEQARKEGYEAARAENRPSDALLEKAYFRGYDAAATGWSRAQSKDDFVEWWLPSLPPDTLQADRETLRQILPQLEAIWDCGEFDEPYVPELIRIVRRVAGLEVGNG